MTQPLPAANMDSNENLLSPHNMEDEIDRFSDFPANQERESLFSHISTHELRNEKEWKTELKEYLTSNLHQALLCSLVVLGLILYVSIEYVLE